MSLSAFAVTDESEFSYATLSDGTIEITGYNGSDVDIVIPNTIKGKKVTAIGDTVFYVSYGSTSNIVSVEIPEGVTSLGEGTFVRCTSLKTVVLPKTLTSIGRMCFYDLGSLTISFCGSSSAWNNISKGESWNKYSKLTINYEYIRPVIPEYDSSFDGGDGSKENPYQVSTAEQLNNVRKNPYAYYIQTANIDIGSFTNWEPIGDMTTPFQGGYDGNNYIINNLSISDVTDAGYFGLFGVATGPVNFDNINLININIDIRDSTKSNSIGKYYHYSSANFVYAYGGSILAASYKDTHNKMPQINNCNVQGNISICGIKNCEDSNMCDITIGGITGAIGTINNSTSNILIDVHGCDIIAGGIVGEYGNINDCVNYGNINCNSKDVDSDRDNIYCGGICGTNSYGSINNSKNQGSLTVCGKNEAVVGGICGNTSSYTKISKCVNEGDIIAKSLYVSSSASGVYVGGIIANDTSIESGSVNNSSNYGNLTALAGDAEGDSTSSFPANCHCGGIVARNNSGTIKNCYNFGLEFIGKSETNSSYYTPKIGRICGSSVDKLQNNYSIDSTTLNGAVPNENIGSDKINGGSVTKEELDDIVECQFHIVEDIVFLEPNKYFKISAFSEKGTDLTELLTWKSSDASVVEIVSPGYIFAKSEGLITVSAEKSSSEMDYCYIYVGDPNHIEYSTVYDKDYYYNGDGFYSNAAQISNAVDIYLSLENCIADELQSMYDKDALLGTYEDEFNSLEVGEFTVTATVSGNDLSFSKDSYSNTYSETFNNIPIETIVDDILVLYPYGLTVSGNKKSYTVNVKIESDDFETIEDTITFSVSDLASKAANEHIDYLNANLTYKTSLHNSYGTNMVKLKDDEEYKFSKYSTFDFDNYYEIVVGDLLIDILNVNQTGNISLLPKVVTEYNSVINSVISTINTIVYDDYGEALDISETAIDKFIKTSKYRDDGVYAENVVFQAIQKTCGNTANAEKINKAFAAADKTKQVCKFLNFGLDTINSIIDFTNRISVFNAYNDASNSFKAVFEKLYESIPTSEIKMREAIKDYINYADNGFTMTAEIIEAYGDLSKKVGTDAITTYLGKSFMDLTSGMVCEWIGSITLSSGATFASTAAFATVQAAFGGFLTGAAIGLCLTDLCCNSSEKAAEMGKIIAMSEYTPYIIETVQYYENNLRTNKNDYAVELFEHAFALHKASQVYITRHTIKALEIKRDSIIENLFDREGEYEQVITDTLSIKSQLENMFCHSNDTTASIVRRTKVIAIKCPVDVLVYDENGNLVVEIRNNTLVYCADGIGVCISESQKYICVPAENEYEVKIVSTGEGTMDYIVYEYDESAKLESKKKIDSIPLSVEKEFNGTIYKTPKGSENCIYSLISGEDEYFTEEDNCAIEDHVTSLINYEKSSCTKEGYSGDVYCEDCKKIIEYGEAILADGHSYSETIVSSTCTENGYVLHCCSTCGDSYKDNFANKLGHDMSAFELIKEASCSEEGMEKSTCSRCSYAETRTIDKFEHINNDGDGFCDNCEYDITSECEHICHSNNWLLSFIWKIVLFFNRIFGNNKYCDCGVAHW